jgi:DNA modification methylase
VPADVERLMAGESADLLFLDPPYNSGYTGYTEEHLTIQNDRMSDTDFKHFLEAVFRSCRSAIKLGASMYVCHSSSWQREFQDALEVAGFEVRCQIIWAKNTFAWALVGTSSSTSRCSTATSRAKRTPGMATNRNPRSGKKTNRRRIVCIQR